MKNLTYVFIVSLLISFLNTYAQEVAPLKLDNVWIYDLNPSLNRVSISDTNIVIDSISYYKVEIEHSSPYWISEHYVRLKTDGYYAVRLDTSYPAPNHEKLYWKKNAVIGDTWENPMPTFPLVYTVLDIFIAPVFGGNYAVKHLEIDGSLVLFDEYWTEEFGKMSRSDYGGLLESLQGCVIDGIVYGDTSFTVVSVENELYLARNFNLEQNFPNPFNPSTSIKFAVSSGQFVTLRVYDILGREVVTLVSEEKPAGIYEIEFDGSGLSSGTYLYQLKTDYCIETKKMQLVK
jgi:hypothetical protein